MPQSWNQSTSIQSMFTAYTTTRAAAAMGGSWEKIGVECIVFLQIIFANFMEANHIESKV